MLNKGTVWLKIVLAVFFCLATTNALPNEVDKKLVCYYTNWSRYRIAGSGEFLPETHVPNLCTHIVYAFATLTKEATVEPFDKWADITLNGYGKINHIKKIAPNIKTILSIGSQQPAAWFSVLLRLDKHKLFARNVREYLRKYDFDGLDLDLQLQQLIVYDTEDYAENIIPLVKTISNEFAKESNITGKPQLSLSMILQGIPSTLLDPGKLSIFLDWITVNTYKYHNINEKFVSHVSPLYSDDNLNSNYSMYYYINSGIPPTKLIMSIPLFGHTYTLYDPDKHNFNSVATSAGIKGQSTQQDGILAYYEICQNIKDNEWEVVKPRPTEMGPYAFKGRQWVSFDDEEMVRMKGQYAQNLGLGGVMLWSLDNDDFLGKCGKVYPLIRAAKEGFMEEHKPAHIDINTLLF